jgi:hypothetical protein
MPRFHRPPVHTAYFTQRELPYVIERVREEILDTFGPLADVPWSSNDDLLRDHLDALPAADDCGPGDPSCEMERLGAVAGSRVLTVDASSSIVQFGGGLTLFTLSTLGGGVEVLPFRGAYDLVTDNYLLRAEAVHTDGILSFCRKVSEADPASTEIPIPWINPVDPGCIGETSFGLRLDVLELIFDGRRNALGIRPIELGLVWNILGNGFSPSFLESRLLWSVAAVPELVAVPGKHTEADLVFNSRVEYRQRLWSSRIELRLHGEAAVGVTHGAAVVLEGGGDLVYHWVIATGTPGNRTAHVISFGGGGGVDFWPTALQPLPPLNGRGILLPDRGAPTDFWGFGVLFIETSLSALHI